VGSWVSHTTTTLNHKVRTLQIAVRKVSTLFLDIKRGFNNINPASLCGTLKVKGVNPYLLPWPKSSLSGRACRVLYKGSPKALAFVSVGTPQGSPVSHSCSSYTYPAYTGRCPWGSPSPIWMTSVFGVFGVRRSEHTYPPEAII